MNRRNFLGRALQAATGAAGATLLARLPQAAWTWVRSSSWTRSTCRSGCAGLTVPIAWLGDEFRHWPWPRKAPPAVSG